MNLGFWILDSGSGSTLFFWLQVFPDFLYLFIFIFLPYQNIHYIILR